MNAKWQAIAREAGLAAEHLAIGVTALGKADYTQQAYYYQAFFALAIGIERTTKLIIVVDHAVKNNGVFPSNKNLRKYGHNIIELLKHVNDISSNLRGVKERLHNSTIHKGILKTLSNFADNLTRYYNLDFITGVPVQKDPINEWYKHVVSPVVSKHYEVHQKQKDELKSNHISHRISKYSHVRCHTENGEMLDSISVVFNQTAVTEFARPYVRLYLMQIIRYLSNVISEVGYLAQSKQMEDIPAFAEFYAIFHNDDSYFKSRKCWSIYKP